LKTPAASPGTTVTTRLTNNLKVDLLVQNDSILLQISRSSDWPSLVEWQTVLRHWPYPVDCVPQAVRLYGRHFLRASLPLTDQAALLIH
jgi:hypothetical protein